MNPKQKQAAIRELRTEVLERILGSLAEQERAEPGDPRYPLAGLVHLTGIGQVPVTQLRAELDRRREIDSRIAGVPVQGGPPA